MLLLVLALSQAPIELQSGMIITQSVREIPKTYRLTGPPIIVRGDNISVDFRGATLEGIDPQADPDQARDTAIVIDGGNTIVLANAHIHGYKIGILARGTHAVALLGNDVSHNWKPRLFSLVEHESLVDWLSFHHNEKGEWLRFGAAIYLQYVQGAELRDNLAVGGMNGLMLVRSTGVMIRDNNFSFNSGLGIGLYRSSEDTIVHNRLDYNVRGYSQGHYTRGQDSADLLLFEQSSRNVVALNSMTHGGDGIFLWAGQTTMDSGSGGAIEHGQDNVIAGNQFHFDSTGIRLWADSIEPSDWGYPKHHDTRSRDYRIGGNEYIGNHAIRSVRNTTGLDTLAVISRPAPPSFLGALRRPSPPLAQRDRSAIIVDEWGPYDWVAPKLWPVDSTRSVPLRLATLGPAGKLRLVSHRGVATPSRAAGRIGDTIVVTPDSSGDWEVVLESAGTSFGYGRFEPRIKWSVRFSVDAPGAPLRAVSRLDYMWYGPPAAYAFLPRSNWSLTATGTVTLPPGTYSLRTISDDAVRVWIDGTLAIDDWTPHESRVDYAPLLAGKHDLRVDYRQVDGWVELRVGVIRGSARSPGSPGPH